MGTIAARHHVKRQSVKRTSMLLNRNVCGRQNPAVGVLDTDCDCFAEAPRLVGRYLCYNASIFAPGMTNARMSMPGPAFR
jgi:hypothetical protein